MKDVLLALLVGWLALSTLDSCADAVVAQQDAAACRIAALQAQEAANTAEWMATLATSDRDVVCDVQWAMTEDPLASHIKTTAALRCPRCRIRTILAADVPLHDGEPP